MEEIMNGQIWRHYKGNRYIILGVGEHTETQEKMVIYSPIDNKEKIWIRPYSMWNNIIDKEKNIKRFERES